ncbi:MAG: hypothetical protein BroJett040_04740 [Oligoflexia bacterium]|nr:MAG: hypothetical protein BroJett040_04740 [Oligoflexia bacterium]
MDYAVEDLIIDFENDKNYWRPLKKGKNELIARAIGISKGFRDVVDATTGLGQDAFMMARLGCTVRAVERVDVIYKKLEQARLQPTENEKLKEILSRIQFIHQDSLQYLESLSESERPEVIYIDPMFPEKKKTALPRKEMQIFQQLVGKDEDAADLVMTARKVAKERVVVKRPLKAPDLVPGVSHHFLGTSVRYDLYITRSL